MKKRFLSVALAGLLSLGCFSACDLLAAENDGGQSTGEETVVGEVLDGEVTEEQWIAALEGLDLFNYTVDSTADGHTDFYGEITSINIVKNENKIKCYYCYLVDGEITCYATKVDGTVYTHYEEGSAWCGWSLGKYRFDVEWFDENSSIIKMMVTGDNGVELSGVKTLSEIVESAKSDMSGYAYDGEKEVYYTLGEEKICEYDTGTTYTVGIEVEFSEGEVYIRQRVNLFGSREGYMEECWSFEEETVDLPEQDELNLFLNGTRDGVCDDCESRVYLHNYYDGSEECLGVKGEYCSVCIYKKEPALVTDGKCDDCGTQENLYYCDGSEEYFGLEGEYCPDCAVERILGELL